MPESGKLPPDAVNSAERLFFPGDSARIKIEFGDVGYGTVPGGFLLRRFRRPLQLFPKLGPLREVELFGADCSLYTRRDGAHGGAKTDVAPRELVRLPAEVQIKQRRCRDRE